MPPTKAELQIDHDRYYEQLNAVRDNCTRAEYGAAISRSVAALPLVDNMMQFDRRYIRRDTADKDLETVEVIEVVLAFAPYLFRHDALAALADLLEQQRRIDRNTTVDLQAKHRAAVQLMWALRKLWGELERLGQLDRAVAASLLSPSHVSADKVLDRWLAMGVLRQIEATSSVELTTRMKDPALGKCPRCGAGAKGAKSKLLESVACPKCKNVVQFTLMPTTAKPKGS